MSGDEGHVDSGLVFYSRLGVLECPFVSIFVLSILTRLIRIRGGSRNFHWDFFGFKIIIGLNLRILYLYSIFLV